MTREFIEMTTIIFSILIATAIITGGIFTMSRIADEADKKNYFECLERTKENTCNSIFYQSKDF